MTQVFSAVHSLERLSQRLFAVLHQPAIVAFTGAESGAGVTTLVEGLGRHLAEEGGTSVLLVDGNFRSPALSALMGERDAVGLWEVFGGSISLQEAVRGTATPNLAVLPAGRVERGLARPPEGDVLLRCLREVRSRFPCVIIDTAPAAAAIETRSLVAGADGVGLVVRAGHSRRETIGNTIDALAMSKANLLGLILNRKPWVPGASS